MDRNTIRHLLVNLGTRAGVSNVHPHRFRHSFAILSLRAGMDVFTLQRLLGHSSLDMVRHYLDIVEADVSEAHRRASPVDNWRL
jgi:site-specific recombinase XerD